ncbi:Crp/Fnr family transcriptional regulator [Methylobacterium indicum]|uniref:Crp/Fnr family transcriptional regulator n=1 Tax=Methylobacterium indicum TaxID=1775910 RepID=UPI001A9105AD|nr:Crp/Fnr family transcriptional regulator [Methylobacterium indicum]
MTATPHSASILLRKLERFGTFSEVERRAITELPVTIRSLGAGQDIVRDHERQSHCCLMLDGWASRYQVCSRGKRQIFSFHIPGDLTDYQSLHLPANDYSVCTLTSAIVAFIPHERLHELISIFPQIAVALWRDAHVDAAISRSWLVGMGVRTACEALAHLLCELYVKLEAAGLAANLRYHLPITQGVLADALGLSNVHVNRVLSELRTRGIFTLSNHVLQIHNWNDLTRYCDFDPSYLHLVPQIAEA